MAIFDPEPEFKEVLSGLLLEDIALGCFHKPIGWATE
jgi:hypothetical protein